ncbi:alpha-L-fucosidase [Pseudoalteromonas phenolica]|uniref:alpha-L-fucosidase n=1 Tax=Pseudoalteromonas phenolica TaxID=161398 RepID=A0A0S2K468_9GAMM|nr:alpha-L-fucosidase [Pseudoalteromonas phenolica]ALO42863.1 hypothetical protein PP2015_2370 [Pseudoalteromonas phenolica]MBE0356002.1 alpha-L-fucosidase [Pseudoalteromonas phenolica O-BC30]RXE94671.1 hypothetical protein D9981_18395 [Pseudoalteromonas phenolica O-BC30]
MFLKRLYSIAMLSLGLTSLNGHAVWSHKEGDPLPTKAPYLTQKFSKQAWESSNFAPTVSVERFQDWRYGMMISFGVTSYSEKELSWGVVETSQRIVPDGTGLANGETPPDAEWVGWSDKLKFEKFDAKEWIKIAQDSGVKYIILLAKHHDGFHLWDTDYSDFKITNSPFKRDYVKEIVDAAHEADMPIGLYYSQRDWYHPHYQPKGFGADKQQAGPQHHKYLKYQFNVVKELLTKYGKIDVLWWDAAWWGGMYEAHHWDAENLTRMVRRLQPYIVMNNRASVPGDFDTPEQRLGGFQDWRPWESAVSLETTWGYSGGALKSPSEVIQALTNTAINNGNLLLSWGPMWSGEFESKQKNVMLEVGKWLSSNGEAIYGTRGGPWKPRAWGGSTRNGKNVYLHIKPNFTGTISMPSLEGINAVKAVTMSGEPVDLNQQQGKIIVGLKETPPETGTIIKLTMDSDVQHITAIDYDGSLEPNTDVGEELSAFGYELVYGQEVKNQADISASSILKTSATTLDKINQKEAFFETRKERKPWIQVSLHAEMSVTGITIKGDLKSDDLQLETSLDGKSWEVVWESDKHDSQAHADVEINGFNAGALMPGKKLRYIRLKNDSNNSSSIKLEQFKFWAKSANSH